MTRSEVEDAVAALPRLDRHELYARFKTLYGRPAPARFSRELVELAVACQMHAQVFGELKPSIRTAIQSCDKWLCRSLPRRARS